MASTSLAKRRSRLPRSTFRGREEAAVPEEYSKRLRRRQTRTTRAEHTMRVEVSDQEHGLATTRHPTDDIAPKADAFTIWKQTERVSLHTKRLKIEHRVSFSPANVPRQSPSGNLNSTACLHDTRMSQRVPTATITTCVRV